MIINAIAKRLSNANRKGFTLVELIIVIAVLSILAAIAVPAYNGYVGDANLHALDTDARNVAHTLQSMILTLQSQGFGPTQIRNALCYVRYYYTNTAATNSTFTYGTYLEGQTTYLLQQAIDNTELYGTYTVSQTYSYAHSTVSGTSNGLYSSFMSANTANRQCVFFEETENADGRSNGITILGVHLRTTQGEHAYYDTSPLQGTVDFVS